jgi:hypothetical protein
LNATKDGRYSVKTTVNGCTSQTSDEVNVKIEGLFKVYPVPNPGMLNVVFYSPVNANKYSLSIHSASGQLIHKETGAASPGVIVKLIDLKKINSGIYHIRIITGKQEYNRGFTKVTN